MSDLFSIGVSGLIASQAALSTTSNNIANASTAGYTRQVTQFKPLPGQQTQLGYLGSGVTAFSVERQTDTYLNDSLRSAQSVASEQSSWYSNVAQISNMLANSATDIGSSMQSYFTSFQQVASDPAATAPRQQVLSTAQTLVDQFQSVGTQLGTLNQSVNQNITDDVNAINTYSQQIATLNVQIRTVGQGGNAAPPNDLLDQRDSAVAGLSKLIGVNVAAQDDGSYNVSFGNGEALVVGGQSYSLAAIPSASDPAQSVLAYGSGNSGSPIPNSLVTGGDLGALMAFRSQSLIPAQQRLGQIATGLALSVNAQHELGHDLSGNPGQAFFALAQPQTIAARANTGGATLTASFVPADVKHLQASDYRLAFDGTSYTITRLSDGSTGVDSSGNAAPATYAASALTGSSGVQVDGLRFSLDHAMAAGDSFTVKPVEGGLTSIGVALTDPAQVAAAGGPAAVAAASSNTGSGALTITAISSAAGPNSFASPATIRFSGSGTYSVSGSRTSDVSGVALPSNGQISVDGITLTLSGTPAANDSFTLANSPSGVGNNQNALALGTLQTRPLMAGGTASFSGLYSDVVGAVGAVTAQYKATSVTAAGVLSGAQAAQQAVSGVNLDEEGANLIKYQQQYQASAKVVQIAATLFQSILQLN